MADWAAAGGKRLPCGCEYDCMGVLRVQCQVHVVMSLPKPHAVSDCWCGMPHDDTALRELRAAIVKKMDTRDYGEFYYALEWALDEFDRRFPSLAAEAQTGEPR